jgi:hypothetical protein
MCVSTLSPLSLARSLQLPMSLGESGNGARYLQYGVIRESSNSGITAGAGRAHVFIRFPIKREIFQF